MGGATFSLERPGNSRASFLPRILQENVTLQRGGISLQDVPICLGVSSLSDTQHLVLGRGAGSAHADRDSETTPSGSSQCLSDLPGPPEAKHSTLETQPSSSCRPPQMTRG